MRFGERNRKLLYFTSLILCLFINACGQNNEENYRLASNYENDAIKLAETGNYDKAIEKQRKAISLDSENEKRPIILAKMLLDRYDEKKVGSDLNEAKLLLEKAISVRPDDILLRNTLIVILEKNGDEQGVLKESLKVVELAPDDLQALTNLAIAYDSLNQNKKARKTFEQVLEKNPNYIYGLYHFGEFEFDLKNFDKATDLFKRATIVQVSPDDSDIKYQELSRKRLEEMETQKTKTATQSAN